jgi:hypothetical protein
VNAPVAEISAQGWDRPPRLPQNVLTGNGRSA